MKSRTFVIHNREQSLRLFQKLSEVVQGQSLSVKVSPWRHPKTLPQLALIHAIIEDIAIWRKMDPQDVKDDIKAEFGTVIVSPSLITGDRVARRKSFGDYEREEMTALIESVLAWCAGQGIPVRKLEVA